MMPDTLLNRVLHEISLHLTGLCVGIFWVVSFVGLARLALWMLTVKL